MTMTHSARITVMLALALSCATTPPLTEPAEPLDPLRILEPSYLPENRPFEVRNDRIYYTQVNFWHDYTHNTTNYRVGTLVPVNTRVKMDLLTQSRKHEPKILTFRIRLADSNTPVMIKNNRTHSDAKDYEIIYRTFSEEPVDLDLFGDETKALILKGQIQEGMTRFQTLLTRGYPPGHRTPDLTSDAWTYWDRRYKTVEVQFDDNRTVLPHRGGLVLPGTTTAPMAPQGNPTKTIEERLEQLEGLRSKGLVSPEEYETKRSDILDDL